VTNAVSPQKGFAVRVSTVFVALALVCMVLPLAMGWGVHDGGMALMYILFPVLSGMAAVASVVHLVKGRSLQGWLEAAVAVGLFGFAMVLFL